jgi:hypothetical protein
MPKMMRWMERALRLRRRRFGEEARAICSEVNAAPPVADWPFEGLSVRE